MSDLSQQEWTAQQASDSNSIILDVRTDQEVEEGMIPEGHSFGYPSGASIHL